MKDGLQLACKKCSKQQKLNRRKKLLNKHKFIRKATQDITNLPIFDMRKELLAKNDIFFSASFVAQSRSGKTFLLKSLLRKIRDMYDIIIVITKSGHNVLYNDPVFDFVTTGANGQYKKVIKMIRLFQEKTNNKLINWLVIFDDFSKPRCALMRDLYTDGRNSSISVIHLVQDITMLQNHCRFNSLYIFLFHQKNPKLIKRTVEHFLLDFIPVPEGIKTKFDKMTFLINWMQGMSENYTSIVLNVDNGSIMKVRA
jgi:hypothetical protein